MAIAEHITRRNMFHDLGDIYDEQFVGKTHPDIMHWPLVEDGRHCLTIVVTYFMFINYIGPAIMRNIRPFNLRWLMVPYNVFLVLSNFYLFIEFAKIRWFGDVEARCNPVYKSIDITENPQIFKLAEITWYFYMTKYIELIDTVIFVLRKKDRQLSRLHIIHHTSVPVIVLLMLRSEPGGYNSFFPLANSFVHCIMYTYYGISALGDEVTIHLKFKKYVTMTQLIQFMMVIYYFASRPFYGCHWEGIVPTSGLMIAVFFLFMFLNFYYQEYVKKDEERATVLEQNGYTKHKKV